jgi:hypothetical protein
VFGMRFGEDEPRDSECVDRGVRQEARADP